MAIHFYGIQTQNGTNENSAAVIPHVRMKSNRLANENTSSGIKILNFLGHYYQIQSLFQVFQCSCTHVFTSFLKD